MVHEEKYRSNNVVTNRLKITWPRGSIRTSKEMGSSRRYKRGLLVVRRTFIRRALRISFASEKAYSYVSR